MNPGDDLVEVWQASGDLDAQLVQAMLRSNGIDSSITGESLRLTHGFSVNKLGLVRIFVRPEDAEVAKALLQETVEVGEEE